MKQRMMALGMIWIGVSAGISTAAMASSLDAARAMCLVGGMDADENILDGKNAAVIVTDSDGEKVIFSNSNAEKEGAYSYFVQTGDNTYYDVEYLGTIDEWGLSLFAFPGGEAGDISDSKFLSVQEIRQNETAKLLYLNEDVEEKEGEILITGSREDSEGYVFLEYDVLSDFDQTIRVPAAAVNEDGECIGIMLPEGNIGSDILAFSFLEEDWEGETEIKYRAGSEEAENPAEYRSEDMTEDGMEDMTEDATKGMTAVSSQDIMEDMAGDLPEEPERDHSGDLAEDPSEENAEEEEDGRQFLNQDGNVYQGSVVDGAIDGIGTCEYANGDYYAGEWNQGVKDGFGRFTWSSGTCYEGEWKNGMMAVYGLQTSEGGTMVGQFGIENIDSTGLTDAYGSENREWKVWIPKNSSSECIRVYQAKKKGDGITEDGLWFSLKPDGSYTCAWYVDGMQISSSLSSKSVGDRKVYTGRFDDYEVENGTLVCQYTGDDGSVDYYIGSFTDGLRNGIGVYLWADGSFHIGDYLDGDFEGEGMYYDGDNASWFNGTWHEDERDGIGWFHSEAYGTSKMTYASGEILDTEIISVLK